MLNSKYIYNIDNSNYRKILKKIRIRRNTNKEFVFNYSNDFRYKEDFDKINTALKMKDKYQRYSYIYDEVCDYLDNLFINRNMCEFYKDKCYSNRCKKFEKTCGCCSNNDGIECKYFDKDHCTIKCSGCKFYICPNLKKKKGPILMKDIFIAYYLLSPRERLVLRYTVFTPKEEIIEKMIKFRI